MTPSISVIVRAYNAGETLEQCLCAIKRSSYKDYELIVVDDGSTDTTERIAKRYADKVIVLPKNIGAAHAGNVALQAARGDIIVNVDSDVVVAPDTLNIIGSYLSGHPEADAITGRLSKCHPHNGFFSQYKNLYMNYIFGRLHEKIDFLYGSIFAVRKRALQLIDAGFAYGEDTYFGMKIVQRGREIRFLKDLEVVHLKEYDLLSFVKNDFLVPFYWARLIILRGGWRQLFKNGVGFAHASRVQIISVLLAPAILIISLLDLFGCLQAHLILPLVLIWFLLNFNFFKFLAKEKNSSFSIGALLITFFDNVIMFSGIVSGFATAPFSGLKGGAVKP